MATDELGEGALVPFEEFGPPDSFEKFKAKARYFLRQHDGHIAVHKLRTSHQLDQTDLAELEEVRRRVAV